VYKGKVNCKKDQGHLENITHFLKIPTTRNFINWKQCICSTARRRVGIQGNRDVRSNHECGWPLLYRTGTVSRFVANTAGGKPYGTTSGHNRTQGTRWPGGVYVNEVHEFKVARSYVCVCTNHPLDPKMIEVRPETVLRRMTTMEGSLP